MSDSDIVTRCPQCNTAFRVTPNQLAVAAGVVRCGSCLAVFKAVDYETKKSENNHSKTDSNTENLERQNINTKNSDSEDSELHNFEFKEEEDVLEFDDEDSMALIEDEVEETLISSDEAIYDLQADEPESKTSLFERQLKPISEQSKENADESWALDMLADLKDEEIQPLNFKRKSKPKPSESSDIDSIQVQPHPSAAPQESETESPAIDPDHDELPEHVLEYNDLKDSQNDLLNIDENSHLDDSDSIDDDLQNDALTIDEGLEAADYIDAELEPHKESKQSDDLQDIEELYFDEDAVTETINMDEAALPSQDSSHDYAARERDITDEEIDNAMNIRTQYAGEELFIRNIEPPPVEMEWYEYDSTKRWLWFLGALAAILILLVQFFIFRFDTLSKHPTYRPFYKEACLKLGCKLPLLVNIDKIRTTNLIVRSHPKRESALVVDAILINTATFEQNYPVLRLEFSDINNTILASRNLEPHDYLKGELAGAREMPINQPIQISIEIVDPGEAATNYQLSVLKAAKF
jgi:predicted Zn finger-like uncharacterized protein